MSPLFSPYTPSLYFYKYAQGPSPSSFTILLSEKKKTLSINSQRCPFTIFISFNRECLEPRASSPEPPSGVRHSQRINILDEKPDLEKELRKSLLNLCFVAAIQITIQYKQVAESEISGYIHLHSLAIAIIFACLFTSHFIGTRIREASRMLEKAAFFLVATTFFSAIATPFRLPMRCAIWAIYILSLIFILVIQNFTHPPSTHRNRKPNQPCFSQPPPILILPFPLATASSPPHMELPRQIGGDVSVAALEAVVVAVE
ncbi:hypothetical protein OIU76_004670 [Salix suchowensis]|nr:hypothetical protein OIU76_004670 [Salix suchowensis]